MLSRFGYLQKNKCSNLGFLKSLCQLTPSSFLQIGPPLKQSSSPPPTPNKQGLIAFLVPHLSNFCTFRPLSMKFAKTIINVYTRLLFWFSIQFCLKLNCFWV